MGKKTHQTSAGILFHNKGKYLMVLPHHRAKDTTKGWGIPKGKQEPGETLQETAVREVYEETALNIKDHGVELSNDVFFTFDVKVNKHTDKTVHAFKAELPDRLVNFDFKCLSFVSNGSPEIALYRWMTLPEALEHVAKSQKDLFLYEEKCLKT